MPLLARVTKRDWRLGAITFALVMAFFTPILWWSAPRPHVHPSFAAPAYDPPPGCEVKRYVGSDAIALACADSRFAFEDWRRFGLTPPGGIGYHQGRKTGIYYRVGDDLVAIRCLSDRCRVEGYERSVFHR